MIETRSRQKALSPPRRLTLSRFVPSVYQVAFLAILGAILIVALAPRLDTDFWWHLKDGQYISTHLTVPAHDFMSYTMSGHSWTDHEWLAEVWLYALYSAMGLWGPIAFFAVVIGATFVLVYLRMSQHGLNRVLSLFIMAAAFVASSASWGPRIQMLTLFFLSLYLVVLQQYGASRNRKLLIALPAAMLLWANVHGGFALGLALLAITLAGESLNTLSRRADAWSLSDIKALGYALLACMGVTMINPNGFRQLLYPLTFVLPNAYTNLIEESASPNFHMPVMMVFEALLLLLIVSAFVGRTRVNWTHLFLVAAFTHLAFSQVRNVAVWAVVVGPLVAYYLQAATPALREAFPQLSYRRRPVKGRIGPILNVTLLALIGLAYVVETVHFVNPTTLRAAETSSYPVGAVHYMRTHTLPKRTFVSYGWGGYLLWNLFPQYRDYMDSRADTLFNNRILRGYLTMYAAKPGWRSTLRANHVQNVLVEPTAPLAQVLGRDSAWKRVYKDDGAVLFTLRM